MFEKIDNQFEPSPQTREAMLYVRKRQILIAGIKHPGLFGIHNFAPDSVLFLVVLILEGVGLYSFYNALEQSDTSIFTAIMATGAMFLIDLLFAFYHHRFNTGINAKLEIDSILKNRQANSGANAGSLHNLDAVKSRKNKAFIFSTLLIVVAAAKFAIFYFLNEGNGEVEYGVVAFMALAYLVAAIIHIKVTGYWVHAIWADWLHKRDENTFKSSGGKQCKAMERPIELDRFSEFSQPLSVGSHSVVTKIDPSGNNQYFLNVVGLITDKEIEELSFKVSNDSARTNIVLAAMEIQIKLV